ncbi:hypothetical protein CAPTEDRAFT_201181 [Capitella teleta]|uniref:Uncharacterized protein n=1 Tax=Capitella teleta TaxID=283909 RepID=R7T8Z1_CAPTE|nr:hypothetical protein CAPTEDRAFT_201181 [Capitella teleta]|eukprot:ELT90169.1 hypothetical protein CAPTEDRAFT_201181 [Capitella teleta]
MKATLFCSALLVLCLCQVGNNSYRMEIRNIRRYRFILSQKTGHGMRDYDHLYESYDAPPEKIWFTAKRIYDTFYMIMGKGSAYARHTLFTSMEVPSREFVITGVKKNTEDIEAWFRLKTQSGHIYVRSEISVRFNSNKSQYLVFDKPRLPRSPAFTLGGEEIPFGT